MAVGDQVEVQLSIHRLRATTAGTFRVAPAMLQPLYAPELAAHSSGWVLRVRAAD